MRFNQNRQKEGEWRKWFAWFPIYVEEINADVWLETLECRYKYVGHGIDIYTYRLPRAENSARSIA